jgi:hypothetical protein
MITNKFSREILHNNFNILRKSKGLNKGDFNKLIRMANVYRPNYFSIGAKLLKGIADNFPGIDEAWLLTPHDEKETHIVAESQSPYNVQPRVKVSELLHKAAVILESNTVYSVALKNNIEAFHHAITCEEALGLANKRIDNLAEQISEIKTRLPAVGE